MGSLQEVFARNLRYYRLHSQLSQTELSERCGLSQGFLAEIERANKFPSPRSIERICEALEIQHYQLFVGPEAYEASMGSRGLEEQLTHMRESIEDVVRSTIHRIVTPKDEDRD